jgi:hypothetical protein
VDTLLDFALAPAARWRTVQRTVGGPCGRGRGSHVWVPTQETAGNQALIWVTGHAGEVTVQDVSDEGFLIANGGQNYYVNVALDADLTDNEYTTAAGNNANSGKSADAPMASLAALLRAYDLDAGDTVYVDTGVYSLATNIVLDAQDSGVRIQGPQVVGHTATLNRGNTAEGRVVFQLNGADNVTLSHLAITGGQYGIQAANVDSDGITVRNSDIFGNTQDGIHCTWLSAPEIRGNRIRVNGLPSATGLTGSGTLDTWSRISKIRLVPAAAFCVCETMRLMASSRA